MHTHYGLSWRSIPVSGDFEETEDDVDWFLAEGTPLLLFFGLVSRFQFSWSLQARLSDAQVGWMVLIRSLVVICGFYGFYGMYD